MDYITKLLAILTLCLSISTTLLSQPVDSSTITDNDRKIEALIQLHENKLNKMRVYELQVHKKRMSEYMRGRDFLITELYDEIALQQMLVKEHKDQIIKDQNVITGLEDLNTKLKAKNRRKTNTILILIAVDVVLVLGVLALN